MSKHTDELLDAVQEIAELIWMEAALSAQDSWLQRIMNKGKWKPDPEMVEGMKEGTTPRLMPKVEVGACCRNGCEKCEQ